MKNIKPFIINFLLISAFFCFIFYFLFFYQKYDWVSVYEYRNVFFQGWIKTCLISLAALIISLIFGLSAALMRISNSEITKKIAWLYIETLRGTPLLVQLLFFYYVVADSIQLNNRLIVGVISLSLFSGAYVAEIIRSGILSLQKSLMDSAVSLGLSKWQIKRYIVAPLVTRQILPALTGQAASIIKDSSLLSIIGIAELTYSAQQINSATFCTLESYFPLAAGYFILTFPISMLSKKLEKRFKYES